MVWTPAESRVVRAGRRGSYDRGHSTARRLAEQRESLLTALAELAAERGVADLNVEDILFRTGNGRNTFYAHFDNMKAAISALEQFGIVQLVGDLEAATANEATPMAHLRALAEAWTQAVNRAPHLARALIFNRNPEPPRLAGALEEALAPHLARALETAYNAGAISRPATTERTRTLAAMVLAITRNELLLPRNPDERKVTADLVELALHVLR